MPSAPPVHRPPGWTPRKPYDNSRTAAKRLSGRTLQTRNQRIKERDMFTCQDCGRVTLPDQLEIDHRISLAAGGDESDGNLASLCGPCHEAKSLRERGCKPKVAIGVDGWPIDAGHHWNKPGGRGS